MTFHVVGMDFFWNYTILITVIYVTWTSAVIPVHYTRSVSSLNQIQALSIGWFFALSPSC